ncbi:class I SAM-dependent methyltransferase [candidate division KSB1 bacterium]|nr:class I SAM-dependent methyltransferase [candidate division KSB1 bacterium]
MLQELDIQHLNDKAVRFIKSLQPDTGIYQNNYSYACYVSLYLYALSYCKGRYVLDAACGFGYGSSILAQSAAQVTGIDLSDERIQYAQLNYQSESTTFEIMDVTETEFPDNHFDCVVSIETFEHLPEELAHPFLREMKRILKPDGVLILSTPNRPIHTQITQTVDHVNEVDVDTLNTYLSTHFSQIEFAYQRKGILDEMKAFYSVVKTDRYKVRRFIPTSIRKWMHRFIAKDLTEDVDVLLPRLAVNKANTLEDVRQAVLQLVVCKP